MPTTDAALEPAVICCGREFRLRRAYDSHMSNHTNCTHCEFAGCRAALKAHAWEAHGLGRPPGPWAAHSNNPSTFAAPHTALATPPREHTQSPDGASSDFARRDGGTFHVIDELDATETVPLEERFPEAEILWPLESNADTEKGQRAPSSTPVAGGVCDHPSAAPDALARPAGCTQPILRSATGAGHSAGCLMPWPADCQVLLIIGPTGSGKSRQLRALAGVNDPDRLVDPSSAADTAADTSARSAADLSTRGAAQHWPTDRAILDGLGTDGSHWLYASRGSNAGPRSCASRHAPTGTHRHKGMPATSTQPPTHAPSTSKHPPQARTPTRTHPNQHARPPPVTQAFA